MLSDRSIFRLPSCIVADHLYVCARPPKPTPRDKTSFAHDRKQSSPLHTIANEQSPLAPLPDRQHVVTLQTNSFNTRQTSASSQLVTARDRQEKKTVKERGNSRNHRMHVMLEIGYRTLDECGVGF